MQKNKYYLKSQLMRRFRDTLPTDRSFRELQMPESSSKFPSRNGEVGGIPPLPARSFAWFRFLEGIDGDIAVIVLPPQEGSSWTAPFSSGKAVFSQLDSWWGARVSNSPPGDLPIWKIGLGRGREIFRGYDCRKLSPVRFHHHFRHKLSAIPQRRERMRERRREIWGDERRQGFSPSFSDFVGESYAYFGIVRVAYIVTRR